MDKTAPTKPRQHDVVQPLSDDMHGLLDRISRTRKLLPPDEAMRLQVMLLSAGQYGSIGHTANAVLAMSALAGFSLAMEVAKTKNEVLKAHGEKN